MIHWTLIISISGDSKSPECQTSSGNTGRLHTFWHLPPCTPTLRKHTYLSPVIVIVKPSYSFPWSLRLGTLVFTVNPSFVLVLNCFQGKRKFTLLVKFIVNSQSAAPTLMFLRRLSECKTSCPLSRQLSVQDAYACPYAPSTLSAQVTLPTAPARGQKRTSEQKAHSLPSVAALTPKSSLWVFSLVHLNWQKLWHVAE